jgi:hypothetical protein
VILKLMLRVLLLKIDVNIGANSSRNRAYSCGLICPMISG